MKENMKNTHESVEQKAQRLYKEGMVTIIRLVGDDLEATVQGHHLYRVTYDQSGRHYRCTCPNQRTVVCSHVRAVIIRLQDPNTI